MPETLRVLPGWVPTYDVASFDVVSAGNFDESQYSPPEGFALGKRQDTDMIIITEYKDGGVYYPYKYNPQTGLVEQK